MTEAATEGETTFKSQIPPERMSMHLQHLRALARHMNITDPLYVLKLSPIIEDFEQDLTLNGRGDLAEESSANKEPRGKTQFPSVTLK